VIQTAAALNPTQLLSLNCLVVGDVLDRMFTVEIPKTENASILKKLIKEKKAPHLNHVAASDLDLWQVSFLIDDFPSQYPITVGPKLRPEKLLSDAFPLELDTNRIHVVVRDPGQCECYVDSGLLLLIHPSRCTHVNATTFCIQIPSSIY
jgi:hypothetical protein